MMTSYKCSRIVGFIALLVTACTAAFAQDIVVRHAQGETVLTHAPARVLTFDLGALDILDRLGVPVAGVPSGPKPAHLAAYAAPGVTEVGTLFEPDYEAVNAARPDLIVVAGRSASKLPQLSKIAPTIDLSGDADDFLGSVRRNVETIGRVFGKNAQAKSEIAKLDAAVAALRRKARDKGRGLLILTTGGRISAYGPGSRFGVLHDGFGMAPAAADLSAGNHGQPISAEFILETDPDWLFVIDRDAAIGQHGASARQVLDNELVRNTTAWKSGQVVYLDPANWYLTGGGLTALHQTVEQLSRAFDDAR